MININQLLAMARIASDKDFANFGLRKILFKDNLAVVTDGHILFELQKAGVDGTLAFNSDEVIKKVKVKDAKGFPLMMIEPGSINSVSLAEENPEYPDYKQLFPVEAETDITCLVNPKLLIKLLECFTENEVMLTFKAKGQPIKFQGKDELGLIMPLRE